jgi:hypothetical protein
VEGESVSSAILLKLRSKSGLLTRETLGQLLDRRALLLLSNLFVLLLVRCRLESLPGQPSAQEVHEDMAQGFEVVSP